MKKSNLLMLLIAFFMIAIVSCEKDEFTEEEAIDKINDLDNEEEMMKDSISNALHFTVNVINASNTSILKSTTGATGVSNMTITAMQNGEIMTDSTDASGMVVFRNLRLGSIAINVKGQGFTEVDLVARMNQKGYYSVQVPVLSTDPANMTTIKGEVKFQGDLTDKDMEYAEGAKVMAIVDPSSSFASSLGSVSGISQVAYSDLTASATTAADGKYSIQVPADAAGTIGYKVYVEDFSYNQTLMMETYNGDDVTGEGNTSMQVPTNFGSNVTGPSSIPGVDGVYATISTPTQNFTQASVTAVIDNFNSIESVNVTSSGSGYTDPLGYYEVIVTDDNAESEGVVRVYVDKKRISFIEVEDGGEGYNSSSQIDLSFEQEPFSATITAVDGTGAVSLYTIDDGGKYLIRDEDAAISITSAGGTGAVVTPNWSWNASGHYYYINSLTFDELGSGYAVDDAITASLSSGLTPAQAQLNLSSGSISTIEVQNPGSGYAKNTNFEVKMDGDAEATAYTDADGRIKYVAVSDGGSGYTAAPAVTIPMYHPEIEMDVDFTDGDISDVSITNNEVYVQHPVVSFFNQATGAELADIEYDVTLSGIQLSVDITEPGTGYVAGNYPTSAKNPTSETTVTVTSGGSVIHDIDLGTGKRSVEE